MMASDVRILNEDLRHELIKTWTEYSLVGPSSRVILYGDLRMLFGVFLLLGDVYFEFLCPLHVLLRLCFKRRSFLFGFLISILEPLRHKISSWIPS